MAMRSNPSRIGDIAELAAAAWLLEQGYEVFRNVSSVGPADLAVRDRATGELMLVDVKTASHRRGTGGALGGVKRKLGLAVLVRSKDGSFRWLPRRRKV